MKTVEKVAVSLPCDVYQWIEAERDRRELTRSELLTRVLRQEMHRQELEERARRYAEAYRKQPETDEERAWVEEGSRALDEFFAGEPRHEEYRG